MNTIRGFTGVITLCFFLWLISENRKEIKFRPVAMGILFQIVIAFLVLKIYIFRAFFLFLNKMVMVLEKATLAGTSLAFGYIGGGRLPFDEKFPGGSFIFAFQSLPMVLVISALSALLFYLKVLPLIVKGFSFILQKVMKVGGAVGLCASATVFVGMVEAPLFVKPYLKNMSRGEIFSIMTTGMATIAGTVMVLYASILSRVMPDALAQILLHSIISAPAALVCSMLMVPPVGKVETGELVPPQIYKSSIDAIVKGTSDGIELLISIIAMLIVFVALVHLVNFGLGTLPDFYGKPVTLQRILGIIMAPVVWIIGIPWSEAQVAGALMGTKTILNEFVAYIDLANLPKGALSQRSTLIMLYAMCGFANLGSLGILIAGLGIMAPEKKDEVVSLGFKSILTGTLASCMTGSVIGMFY
ncbi:MAG: nucleoside:proton symporter [Nitrospirae bacterium]|nr:nucleoside:proton symporter [Nitrospirota bacterium]MBF0536230.1 nucleoside:proton symporter [Nitrospirota bacterium]MBF0617337.1 nucleoside:proton symporter [Nitrospirota bacterium]